MGVPTKLDATGNLVEWDGAIITGAIVGISQEPARNRTTSGIPQLVNPLTISVANQPNSVIIALPPFDDGKLGIYNNINDTYFWGQVGPSQLAANAVLGSQYGMTKDSDGHWYVDLTKATPGTNTVLTVTQVDDFDPRGVFFQFLGSSVQPQ
jgi:hypothetical protein